MCHWCSLLIWINSSFQQNQVGVEFWSIISTLKTNLHFSADVNIRPKGDLLLIYSYGINACYD